MPLPHHYRANPRQIDDSTKKVHGFVKIYRPNKKTGELEFIELVDPFKELTPTNNPCRNYPYRFNRKEPSKNE